MKALRACYYIFMQQHLKALSNKKIAGGAAALLNCPLSTINCQLKKTMPPRNVPNDTPLHLNKIEARQRLLNCPLSTLNSQLK